jgi:hypothetical protein
MSSSRPEPHPHLRPEEARTQGNTRKKQGGYAGDRENPGGDRQAGYREWLVGADGHVRDGEIEPDCSRNRTGSTPSDASVAMGERLPDGSGSSAEMQTMDTDKKKAILDRFARGMTWHEVARSTGLSVATIWRWGRADPEFAAAIKQACIEPDRAVEAVTFANCLDPDPAHNTLRMFWLKSRVPHRYRERLDRTSAGDRFGYSGRAQDPPR